MLVLIVDDEPVARMLHMSIVARMRDVSAVGAATVAEARSLIAAAPPQVVILDMQLPDGNGLDVVAALEEQNANAAIIVITAYLEQWKKKILPRERIHLLGKPTSVHELRQLVEQIFHSETPLSPFSPLDYVQLACMGQHSAVIECVGPDSRGDIVIEKGQLWSARDERGEGIEAFNRLALPKSCHVHVLPARKPPGVRNLEERWELLALEAIRASDEASRSTAPKVTPPAVPPAADRAAASAPLPVSPPPEPVPADFDACVERALRAVLARDFPTAISEFEKALVLRPDDSLVRHRLERLRLVRTRA